MQLVLTIFYTTLVIIVVAIAALFVANRLDVFGYQVKIVQSGSMEPAIATGGIIITAPSATYAVGDVITYGADTATKIPTTHRIVAVETSPLGRPLYTTKGDANEELDPIKVQHNEVHGKVLVDVPYVGYVLEFARTPWGYGLLVGIPALIIILDEFADIMWEIHKYRARKRKGAVGYRTPARERMPRDGKGGGKVGGRQPVAGRPAAAPPPAAARPSASVFTPQSVQRKRPASPSDPYDLDLRSFTYQKI